MMTLYNQGKRNTNRPTCTEAIKVNTRAAFKLYSAGLLGTVYHAARKCSLLLCLSPTGNFCYQGGQLNCG